jgi:predicted RNA-binding protein with TRAM domain
MVYSRKRDRSRSEGRNRGSGFRANRRTRASRYTRGIEAGQEYVVSIIDLSHSGDGMARLGECIILVPETSIGEKVRVRVTEVAKGVARGSAIRDHSGHQLQHI